MLLHPKLRVYGDAKLRWDEMSKNASRPAQPGYVHSHIPHHCTDKDSNEPVTVRNRLDFPGMRVTSLPSNKEVKLPDPMENKLNLKFLFLEHQKMNFQK